jgi:hypothetical protein
MPGVNGICNTKMSLCRGNIELLLRRDAALRNFRNLVRVGTSHTRRWADESLRRFGYTVAGTVGMVLPHGRST